MVGAFTTDGVMRYAYKILVGKRKRKYYMGYLRVDGRVISTP
jgi:hypothetical protein